MSDGFAPDFPIAAYEQQLEPEEFRALIYGHPQGQYVRWWKASIDPTFNPKTGLQQAQAGNQKWLHEEQDTKGFKGVIADGRVMKRYMSQGEFVTGDMTIMTMPDELPLGDHDWIVPVGREYNSNRYGSLHTLQMKEAILRGGRAAAGAGTVTASGAAITGTGTTFLTDFRTGDLLRASGQTVRVASVADNLHLSVDTAPSPVWNGNTYEKLTESVSYWPAVSLDTVRSSSKIYILGVDVRLADDGKSLQWLTTGCPAAGTPLSLIYRYLPRYVVLSDLGLFNTDVQGVSLPQTVTMRLFKPDTLTE